MGRLDRPGSTVIKSTKVGKESGTCGRDGISNFCKQVSEMHACTPVNPKSQNAMRHFQVSQPGEEHG
jgi:hypothetical protein